ncbi:MAG: flagellar hook-associated protein FlgL [Solirubrobacteraceae bacterium]|nr:flagellar hook-associated protein FlgL [Solirubrobacteraceae bacterium]
MSVQVRITHNMMASSMLADVQRASSSMARTSEQISSGKRIDSPSDDPVGATRALVIQSSLSANDGYKAAAEATAGWTQTTEGALSSIVDIVQSTKELVVQANNDTLQPSDRQKLASKLSEMLEQVKATANARYGDQYVLSGERSDIPPYTAGASDTYGGDTGTVIRTIGPNQPVQINVTGDAVLGSGGGDGKLIDTLRTAIANLNGGTAADLANLRGPILANLATNLDTILTARAQVASASVRAELATDRIDDLKVTMTDQLSQVVDTDYAEAITKFSSQKTIYQAALQAGAQVIQPSLMDFLR